MNIQFNINIDDRFVAKFKKFFSPRNSALVTVVCILFAGIILVSAATLTGELKIFNPGDPVVAEEVNQNFALLEDGLHNLVPPGTVVPFAGKVFDENVPPPANVPQADSKQPPAGWLLCNGQEVSKTQYPRLYAAIGDLYGPAKTDGKFTLPDFRGVFPKGAGTTNREKNSKDAKGGYYSGLLGIYSQDQFQGHKHTIQVRGYDGGSGYGGNYTSSGGLQNAPSWPVEGHIEFQEITSYKDGFTPRVGTTTEPQSLGVNFIIKY